MKESPLIIKSKKFALDVINSCKELRNAKCESALINRFLRSGTSIGANIREAIYAHSKADFIAKLQIALKECSESEYSSPPSIPQKAAVKSCDLRHLFF